MNSRKVHYSCFVVCLSVLLGFSWSAQAAAGDAVDLRLAVGPSWGGAGTPLPVPPAAKAKSVVIPVPASEPWDVLWMDVWQKTNQIFLIGVADTLKQAPACTGNLGLEVIVRQTVRAVRDRKYGDAVNWMAQFQDRSLCLSYEGARGLDFALTFYAYRAIKELPADQQRIAIHGTFNLGMLAYDQISYTGRSWWQGFLRLDYPQMVAQMNAYPVQELGFWSFNIQNGLLEQSTSKQGLLDMLATLENPGGGTNTGGVVGGSGTVGSGSSPPGSVNTGAGGMLGLSVGARGAGVVSCTVAASGSPGGRGMITCLQKATVANDTRPSVTGGVAGLFDPGVSVRDPQCLLSTGLKDYVPPPDKPKEKPQPKQTEPKPYVPPDGKEPSESGSTLKKVEKIFDDTVDFLKSPFSSSSTPSTPTEGMTAPGTPPGPGGTGGCGNASNAARMAQAVANCVQGGSSAAVPGKIPAPGGIDPTIARFAEPPPGGAGGKVDCLMQGGSQVRTSSIDPKCAKAMCAPGAPCSCEPGGVAGSQGAPQLGQPPLKAGPDCMDPNVPCGPGTGGITPGKTPPVGPGPMGGPSTTPVPATRGIGTVPQLQQQKGAIPGSPLQQIR